MIVTKKDILLYVPNVLGYVRIVLSLLGLYYAVIFLHRFSSSDDIPLRAVATWIGACALDLVDGILARKFNQTSNFGVLLDIVADNVLRSCIWIAVIISATVMSATLVVDDDSLQQHLSADVILTIIVSALIICLEWSTLVATQVHAAIDGGVHWKNTREKGDPWLVRKYFANNFRNPVGM